MVTRFAPAPTGYLHLGHVVNAIHIWRAARAAGGTVLLRIEDHDRERCRPEYEAALLEDLDWLGFVPDAPPVRQSDRGAIYEATAARLREQRLLYACPCTRRVLGSGGPEGRGAEMPYPGTCRDLDLPFDGDVGWRVRLPRETITFKDQWCGTQTQTPADQCGDMLIRDRRGNWTYQFVATVDDHLQGITHVIRGVDLLPSTGRQILLGRLIGRKTPAHFAHHALIMKSPTQKLSKSDGDTGIRDLRAAGRTRAQLLALASIHVEEV